MNLTKLLIADDEENIRTILTRFLEKKGFEIISASDGNQALEILSQQDIPLALLDIRMPELTGLEILDRSSEFQTPTEIVIMTAQDTMENTLEAMKKGAFDYITKPFDLTEVAVVMQKAQEVSRLKQENEELKSNLSAVKSSKATIVGNSKPIRELFKTIGRMANQDVTVLIQGESGTGKELFARVIHESSKRNTHPFIAVNCSAIPQQLLESELFGHIKGAFTGADRDKKGYFESANQGTLFLDEIGDMPMELQSKLLRVLQEQEIQRVGESKTIPIDVRIIAATNQPLQERVRDNKFREDLFFRLNVVPLYLPSLRERKEDIPTLVEFFLKQTALQFDLPPKKIAAKALQYLKEQNWPGNIRQLENLIKRAVVLSQSNLLEEDDFLRVIQEAAGTQNFPSQLKRLGDLEIFIENNLDHLLSLTQAPNQDLHAKILPLLERPLLRWALKKTKGNQLKAAEILGINRNTLRKKLRELKVDRRGLLDG